MKSKIIAVVVLLVTMGVALSLIYKYENYKTKELNKKIDMTIKFSCEYSYWEGQKDALKGDIRVDTLNKEWIKCPWDDDSVYIYNPKLSIVENAELVKKEVHYKISQKRIPNESSFQFRSLLESKK